ncbi:alpha-L-fucosidase [Actinomadura craniellae]|uniref:alpha-L-fucosidase n=1 Tax=Actinomadura craniellae TaxID=2231787 RepID=A0A365GWV2_9ACTN|nr:alpha-L-fucosidase [Actinomadura craniellae]RAY11300.1 alpha-L-fucosidase [Actinomadura craniellae]
MTPNTEHSNGRVPAWFDDAKVGILIHWGSASMPAYAPVRRSRTLDPYFDGDLYERVASEAWWRTDPDAMMYQNALHLPGSAVSRYHAENYGDLPYEAFVERFRDETIPGWDPDPWTDLFAHAGARYVIFGAKSEDGFLLWPSEHPNPYREDWQSERDVVGELAASVRGRNMRFGIYYPSWDFTFSDPPVSDLTSAMVAVPQEADYRDQFAAQWRELILRYRPSALWADWGVSPPGTDLAGLYSWYHEQVADGLFNDRFDLAEQTAGTLPADFVTPERTTVPPDDRKWEALWGLSKSYCFNRQETEADHIAPTTLIHTMVDVIARGGNMLINVGPTGSGAIPWAQAQRLLAVGHWLRLNGAAIYGTRPWTTVAGLSDEGLQVRYTSTSDAVYAIVLGAPRTAALGLDLRLDTQAEVRLVGRPGALRTSRSPHGTVVELPEPADDQVPAFSLQITPRSAVHHVNHVIDLSAAPGTASLPNRQPIRTPP